MDKSDLAIQLFLAGTGINVLIAMIPVAKWPRRIWITLGSLLIIAGLFWPQLKSYSLIPAQLALSLMNLATNAWAWFILLIFTESFLVANSLIRGEPHLFSSPRLPWLRTILHLPNKQIPQQVFVGQISVDLSHLDVESYILFNIHLICFTGNLVLEKAPSGYICYDDTSMPRHIRLDPSPQYQRSDFQIPRGESVITLLQSIAPIIRERIIAAQRKKDPQQFTFQRLNANVLAGSEEIRLPLWDGIASRHDITFGRLIFDDIVAHV